MDSFLGIPLQEITSSGNNLIHWKGIVGDVLVSISAKVLSKDNMFYVVYIDLCGYPEKWWPENRFKLAEASGDNLAFIEMDIKRQLKRLHINL